MGFKTLTCGIQTDTIPTVVLFSLVLTNTCLSYKQSTFTPSQQCQMLPKVASLSHLFYMHILWCDLVIFTVREKLYFVFLGIRLLMNSCGGRNAVWILRLNHRRTRALGFNAWDVPQWIHLPPCDEAPVSMRRNHTESTMTSSSHPWPNQSRKWTASAAVRVGTS